MPVQWAKEIDEKTALPEGTDISIMRQMQFCHQQILDYSVVRVGSWYPGLHVYKSNQQEKD